MKRTIAVILVAVVAGIMSPAKQERIQSVDDRLIELLIDYHDIPTGKFRKTKMTELLGRIRSVAAFHEAGLDSLPDNIVRRSYRFFDLGSQEKVSEYGFDIFTIAEGRNADGYDVVGVRLTFRAPSGTIYYNHILPANDNPLGLYSLQAEISSNAPPSP